MANIQNNRKNHSMWPLPQTNYNYLRQQWCLHVRSSVRTHVRTYVRTHVCTYTPHVRSYRVSVVQSGQFKICIGGFRSCKNSASWGSRHFFCTTKRTERPKGTTERQNVRPRDRNMYDRTYDRTTKSVRPNDQKRTTERPQYVGPNGHVNVRTYDQLKTHIERFLFGKTCCERFFSNFWLDIQWRNSHSQQQFVLNVGYPISSQKHVSGTSTLWSVSLRPKLTLISLIQTTKKKKTQKNTTNLLD